MFRLFFLLLAVGLFGIAAEQREMDVTSRMGLQVGQQRRQVRSRLVERFVQTISKEAGHNYPETISGDTDFLVKWRENNNHIFFHLFFAGEYSEEYLPVIYEPFLPG